MFIDGFQRVVALLYKALKFKNQEAFNEIDKTLENYEKVLTEDYFGGKRPGITDYMIWPWFERFRSLKTISNYEVDKKRFPKLQGWYIKMILLPEVKETHTIKEYMVEFYKVSLTNQEPDYDFGLPKPPEEEAPKNEATENASAAESEPK